MAAMGLFNKFDDASMLIISKCINPIINKWIIKLTKATHKITRSLFSFVFLKEIFDKVVPRIWISPY